MNEEQPAGDARAAPALEAHQHMWLCHFAGSPRGTAGLGRPRGAHDPAPHPHHGMQGRCGNCGNCGNCGARLAGPYCHARGQRGHLHRSLLHLAEEILHGVLHFDTARCRCWWPGPGC